MCAPSVGTKGFLYKTLQDYDRTAVSCDWDENLTRYIAIENIVLSATDTDCIYKGMKAHA